MPRKNIFKPSISYPVNLLLKDKSEVNIFLNINADSVTILSGRS